MANGAERACDAPVIRVDALDAWQPLTGRSADRGFSAGSSERSADSAATPHAARQAALAAEIAALQPRRPPGMVDPNSRHKLAWDWLVSALVVLSTLSTPLDLAFFDASCRTLDPQVPHASQFSALTRACRGEPASDAAAAAYEAHRFTLRAACKPTEVEALDRLVDAVFWLDILLTFCTGIVLERAAGIEYRRGVVARAYLSRGCFLDVLSALPYDAIGAVLARGGGGGGDSRALMLKLLRLPRLLRLSRLLRMLEGLSSATLFRGLALVGTYILIGHWAACAFFYISKWQIWHSASGWAESGAGLRPWALTECLQFESTPSRYTASLYWALTTMATVGFGDVTPGTNMERCFAMTLQLVAGVLQGVVCGNLGVAMAGFNRGAAAVKERVGELRTLARAHALPQPLLARCEAAAAAQVLATRGWDADDAMRDVSGSLRREAEEATAGARALAAAPLFRDANPPLPRGFTAAVARRAQPLALPPGELAVRAGDADGAACLVSRGALRVAPRITDCGPALACGAKVAAPSTILRAGDLFGDAEAVLCRQAAADVRALNHVTLLAVSRSGLDAALEEYPEALTPLTAGCLAREADAAADAEAAAVATAEAAKATLERSGARRIGRAGTGGAGGEASGALLDASVPMLASLHASSVSRKALGAAPADAQAAVARWGKAGTAARMVVRLAGAAHERRASAAVTPRQQAPSDDALPGADWSGFNSRLAAVVAAQAASFDAVCSRLAAVASRQSSIFPSATAL